MPAIHLTPAARQAIADSLADAGETALRLSISERFEHQMSVGGREPADVVADCGEGGGVTILLDPESARRGEGVTIDFVVRAAGPGFTIDNPNEPKIRQLSAPELKAMIESDAPPVLMDVRTPEERAIARIDGSRLLDQAGYEYMLTLDRDTPIVFQCHHGIRSQAAAENCLREGFRNLYNLIGGIDAWSRLVDQGIPSILKQRKREREGRRE